jgi:DNA repair exonuclease SbcCD ATPase subunit
VRRSVAQLSGGEKKRVALALGLGLAQVAAARGRLTSNVLVLDEVWVCVCVWGGGV